MAKDQTYKIAVNNKLNLHLPTHKIKKLLILGNTVNLFGFVDTENDRIDCSKMNEVDRERYFWLISKIREGVKIVIIGDKEVKHYYEDLFSIICKLHSKDGNHLTPKHTFKRSLNNNDYINKINKLVVKMPHFDVSIMNPPYNVAVRIFEKVLDISKIIITVQPTKWLITERQNKSIINKLKSAYCNIKIINGNEYFTAKFAQDLSINYIDKTKKQKIIVNDKEYTEFSEIKKYSLDEKLECFAKKIGDIKDSIWDHIKGTHIYYYGYEANPNEDWWIIKIPEIRGNISKTGKKESDDFYTIISNDEAFVNKVKGQFKNIRYIKNSRGNIESGYFAFDTENELNNFIKYIKTDFIRACLMLTKTHNNQFRGCFKKVPWFDFSDPHFEKTPHEIDNWLFNKYKISNEIRNHIEELLPDYYNIRQNND